MRHHFHFPSFLLVLGLLAGLSACKAAQDHESYVHQASKMTVTAEEPLVRYYVVADG